MVQKRVLALVLAFTVLSSVGAVPSGKSSRGPGGWVQIQTGNGTGCAFGTPYSFFYREGTDAGLLLIYFQGGGACWDWVSCAGLFDSSVEADELSGYGGIFDNQNPRNPFREFEMVFVPYCTGDVHVGNITRTYGDDPSVQPISHNGYHNVRAVLEWLSTRDIHPRTVVVAGASAGAYGALFYTPEIARQFSHAHIVMLGDSGVPLLSDNAKVLHTWNADSVLDLLWRHKRSDEGDRDLLREAYLQASREGPGVRIAQITSNHDAIQSAFYLVSGSPNWRTATYKLLADVSGFAPRFRSFIVEGADHGLLRTDAFYSYVAGGVYLWQWVGDLIRGKEVPNVRCAECTEN